MNAFNVTRITHEQYIDIYSWLQVREERQGNSQVNILKFVTLVDEGHEIEFVYEGRKYSAAYCKINEKIINLSKRSSVRLDFFDRLK